MRIYLGLGSNLGDRESHLRSAIDSLRQAGLNILRSASLYLTEPRDFTEQPWFLNTVVEAETEWSPERLLEECNAIELAAGRVRSATTVNGPRTIDIDILLFGTAVIQRAGLTIPHPRYAARRFVLVPLHELAPDLRDPQAGDRVRQLLDRCEDAAQIRIYGPPLSL